MMSPRLNEGVLSDQLSGLQYFVVIGINPEPWAVGKAFATRIGSGRIKAGISPNKKVSTYQEALREEIKSQVSEHSPYSMLPEDEHVCLRLFFWRQIEVGYTNNKRMQSNIADVTNLQKSTEDALQGIYYRNDRNNLSVTSRLVDQALTTVPTVIGIMGSLSQEQRILGIALDDVTQVRAQLVDEILEQENNPEDRNAW